MPYLLTVIRPQIVQGFRGLCVAQPTQMPWVLLVGFPQTEQDFRGMRGPVACSR